MHEVKASLKRLGYLYLLMAFSFIPSNLMPYRFPYENMMSLYLFMLTTCLFLYYYWRVTQHRRMRGLMLTLAFMEMLLMLLRGIKYSVFGNIFFIGRYCWYLYWIPLLCIPVLMFYISLFIYAKDERQTMRKWGWVAGVTVVLILLVFTNDLHQMVYRFQPGFADWDSAYENCWLYVVITVWAYGFYVVSVAVLVVKSSIEKATYHAWVILIPFTIGVVMLLLIFTGTMPHIGGYTAFQFPEALGFMVAGVMECCIQLGLIPTNENYRGLMKESSVPVLITDRMGNVVFRSKAAKELTKEQFSAPDGTRIGEHTILRRVEISGGYGFWENDVTELDRLGEELKEAGEALAEESELVRLQNDLKEKQAKIEQRTFVYDMISKRTQHQLLAISRISEQALKSGDEEEKDRCRKEIALRGAYIKRYANLMLLSEDTGVVSTKELGLSVIEVLRYLNRCGVPGELLHSADSFLPAEQALAAFEAFEILLEEYLSGMTGAFVNMEAQDDGFVFRLTLENVPANIPAAVTEKLASCGIRTAVEYEDEIGYIGFLFPKGGEKV